MTSVRTRVGIALALVALTVAGSAALLTTPLLRSTSTDLVRQPLARQAELLARLPPRALASARVEQAADARDVAVGLISADGVATGAGTALRDLQRERLVAGGDVSGTGVMGGRRVLVEARPVTGGGGVVVITDAAAVNDVVAAQRRRLLMAIGLGLLVALVLSGWVAGWLGRPLRELSDAARRMAAGERGVVPPASGVAEVDATAQALTHLDEALRTSEERQRRFLLSVTHELRTPLTAIKGYSEQLADGAVTAEELTTIGATLEAETDRAIRYVGDLLALARLEADDFPLRHGPVEIGSLLADTVADWAPRAEARQVHVETLPAPDVGQLRTDGGRLRQVLDALVDNAVRVCDAGCRITLAADRTPDGVSVTVTDDGPGFAPEDADRIFVPGALRRAYPDRPTGGQGLGLSIAHRLTRRLGGSLTLATDPGTRGARFVISLPRG